MDLRLQQLTDWTAHKLGDMGIATPPAFALTPVSGDASFRRYFRAHAAAGRWIAMDAPPAQEDSAPFLAIVRSWRPQGIHVPEVQAADLAQGFLLLEDFGDELYWGALNEDTADRLYGGALRTLLHIQQSNAPSDYALPPYSADLLQTEMNLFRDWLCGQLLDLELPADWFDPLCDLLIRNALDQPQVPVHRDYHARNLLVLDADHPGVLDFQDAVQGPLTYDLVSLLRDCYLQWPETRVRAWALDYADQARTAGLHDQDDATFWCWFNRMGIQRHLKASGIFARLWLRDGKPGYLADIPRTLAHILTASAGSPELNPLCEWIRGPMRTAMLRLEPLAAATREYLE